MTQMEYDLGLNKLVICHHCVGWEADVWKVIEKDEMWQPVFFGTREQCVAYCTKRFTYFVKSLLG